MQQLKTTTLISALLAALAATPALADKGGKGGGKHGRGGDHDRVVRVDRDHDDRRHGRDDDRRHFRGDDDRRHVRDDDRHHRHARSVGRDCPPGLAKKHNGCRPPGLAKRDDDHRHAHRLAVGRPIPPGAIYTIPAPVLTTLPPPPYGYRYALVDDRVVLVSERSDIVVEIIRSLLG